MVTWDDSWSFTVTYKTPPVEVPKARISSVSITFEDGEVKQVSRGGAITVQKKVTAITAVVYNDGADGTIYADCIVGLRAGTGSSLGQKSARVVKGKWTTFVWSVNISSPATYYITVKAGH